MPDANNAVPDATVASQTNCYCSSTWSAFIYSLNILNEMKFNKTN